MSTKVCKWTREKGFPVDFVDPTRRSHLDPTIVITESQGESLRRYTGGFKDEENKIWNAALPLTMPQSRDISNDKDAIIVKKRIEKLRKELHKYGSEIDDCKPAPKQLVTNEEVRKLEARKLSTRRPTDFSHLFLQNLDNDENNRVILKNFQERQKIIEKLKEHLVPSPLENKKKIMIKTQTPLEVAKFCQNQIEENSKKRVAFVKDRALWGNEAYREYLLDREDKEMKLKNAKNLQLKTRQELDKLSEEKRGRWLKEKQKEVTEKINMSIGNEMLEKKKIIDNKVKQDERAVHLSAQRKLDEQRQEFKRLDEEREKFEVERNLRYSVERRALARHFRRDIKEKMAGNTRTKPEQ